MNKNFIKVLIFVFVFYMSALLMPVGTQAAGVTLTVDMGAGAGAEAEVAVSSASEFYFSYTASATEFATGETITITFPTGFSSVTSCAAPTTDADGDAAADGSGNAVGLVYTYTFSAPTTVAATTGVEICVAATSHASAGNYKVTIEDTNDIDFGADLIYVGDDNDVTVTAAVDTILTFAIRLSDDTDYTNACDLGTLGFAVSTCDYRLKVQTNANDGYSVSFTTDGLLNSVSGNDIDDVTDGTVDSGEEYGMAFDGGAATDGVVTETAPYNTDDTAMPTTGSIVSLYSVDGPNAAATTDTTNTALVTHKAIIDAATEAGDYDQVVSYYVTANF